MTDTMVEAATYKSAALRMARDMATLLADRTVPEALRKEIEDACDECLFFLYHWSPHMRLK